MARAEVTATLTTDQLAALVEVLRSGSFEDAASRLRITPSAVSQRIKSIEEQIGSMVVIRSKPCRPTAVGQRLMQHFEEIMILENRLGADLGKAPDPAILRIGLDEDANSALIIAAMSEVGGGACWIW